MGDGVLPDAKVKGPLAPYAPGVAGPLTEAGCCSWSVRQQLDFMAQLSGWLAWNHLVAGELTPIVVRRVLAVRRASGKLLVSQRGAAPLLDYLDGLGVLPADPAPDTPQDALLAEYRVYLSRERGLAEGTIRNHLVVAAVVFAKVGDPLGEGLRDLPAGQALAIAAIQFRGVSASTAQGRASSMRILLRFLSATGRIPADLAAAIPAVASRRSSLPRRLPAGTAATVVRGCDHDTEGGLQARAIVLLLARLGLRESDVAALTLEDIDWRAGEITIHGKGGRIDTLPLVRDAGEAIAAYLHRRPRCATRAVFVTLYAPRRAMTPSAVRSAVYNAFTAAGVERAAPHRLRHTVASDLLDAGASLRDISQVLRQEELSTVAVYAKVDRSRLVMLARPWPLPEQAGTG